VIPVGRRSPSIDVHASVTSNAKTGADTKVHLELPAGWLATPSEVALHFDHEGEVQNADFKLTTLQSAAPVAAKTYTIRAVAQYDGRSIAKAIK